MFPYLFCFIVLDYTGAYTSYLMKQNGITKAMLRKTDFIMEDWTQLVSICIFIS